MQRVFDDVEAFCVFIGYTRSGHSLVGSILDAHDEAVIAHEGRVFEVVPSLQSLRAQAADDIERYGEVIPRTRREVKLALGGRRGTTGRLQITHREALFRYLIARSQVQSDQGRPGWRLSPEGNPTVISYGVAGGWQGRYTRLRVIGAKRGQEPPLVWAANPNVFDELADLVRAPVRMVHVYRNPWDNIASMTRAVGANATKRYFKRAQLIAQIKRAGRWPILDVCLEDLTADPAAQTLRLFEWFGLHATADLVGACAALVDPEANPSRTTREWTSADVREVAKRMGSIPWLDRYPDTPA